MGCPLGYLIIYHKVVTGEFPVALPRHGDRRCLMTALIAAGQKGAVYLSGALCRDSFLLRTLGDPAWIEGCSHGWPNVAPILEPRLFTPSIMHRFALCVRFAVVRATVGEARGPWPYPSAAAGAKALLRSTDFRRPASASAVYRCPL